jgi:hypothetical protein
MTSGGQATARRTHFTPSFDGLIKPPGLTPFPGKNDYDNRFKFL